MRRFSCAARVLISYFKYFNAECRYTILTNVRAWRRWGDQGTSAQPFTKAKLKYKCLAHVRPLDLPQLLQTHVSGSLFLSSQF